VSFARAASPPAAQWSSAHPLPGALLLSRRGGPLLFAAGCTDNPAARIRGGEPAGGPERLGDVRDLTRRGHAASAIDVDSQVMIDEDR
jgi:hypothetical protein